MGNPILNQAVFHGRGILNTAQMIWVNYNISLT